MTELRLALDRASVRRIDADGHLHVSLTPVTKANTCPYLGREIPKWQELGLKADKVYKLFRDPAELEKAVESFNGKPVFMGHRAVSAADHDHDNNVGSMTGAVWKPPYVMAALDIWPKTAIDAIESEEHAELSSAYRYVAVMEPGKAPDGTSYDGRMTQIDCSHVALVPKGRAGSDVRVHDAAPTRMKERFPMPKTAVLSRTAATAQGALMAYAKHRLAQDAKIDLLPILKGVTAKNIKAKAPAIAKAFDAALRPKLAQDADMDQADVADIVEQIAEVVAEQSDEIAAKVGDEPDATDAGANWADVSAFLKGKISDEDLAELKKMFGGDDEADAEDQRKKGMPVTPSAQDKDKPMVTQAAMDAALASKDAAIAQARKDAAADALRMSRDIRDAERFVHPWVGDLPAAYDSVEGVHRAALDVLGVKHDGKHPDALADIIGAQRKPGDAPAARIAQDSKPAAVVSYDAKSFPNSGRLK